MLKTLLKCPNRFVSAAFLNKKIPETVSVKSFGITSGYLELGLFQNGYDIEVYSNRYFIYEFWKCLINSPYTVLRAVRFFHDNLNAADLARYKEKWYEKFEDPYDRAAVYYLLNRYSDTGTFAGNTLTKHNFSKLNLMSLEKVAPTAKNLNLSFLPGEDMIKFIEEVGGDHITLLPIGKFKRDFILKKNVTTIDSANYDNEKLKEHIKGDKHRTILVYKYDEHVDAFYNNKTYINKFGFVTENPGLAEDLIVSNF